MKITKIHIIIFFLALCGLILHLKTAFWESSEPWSAFSFGMLIVSLVPYAIIITASKKALWGPLCAAILVFLLDLYMHLEVFVWPTSSTAAIGLIFMPIWNSILVIPLSFYAGHYLEKKIKKGISHNEPIEADRE